MRCLYERASCCLLASSLAAFSDFLCSCTSVFFCSRMPWSNLHAPHDILDIVSSSRDKRCSTAVYKPSTRVTAATEIQHCKFYVRLHSGHLNLLIILLQMCCKKDIIQNRLQTVMQDYSTTGFATDSATDCGDRAHASRWPARSGYSSRLLLFRRFTISLMRLGTEIFLTSLLSLKLTCEAQSAHTCSQAKGCLSWHPI